VHEDRRGPGLASAARRQEALLTRLDEVAEGRRRRPALASEPQGRTLSPGGPERSGGGAKRLDQGRGPEATAFTPGLGAVVRTPGLSSRPQSGHNVRYADTGCVHQHAACSERRPADEPQVLAPSATSCMVAARASGASARYARIWNKRWHSFASSMMSGIRTHFGAVVLVRHRRRGRRERPSGMRRERVALGSEPSPADRQRLSAGAR
jgi:hypothetical protein